MATDTILQSENSIIIISPDEAILLFDEVTEMPIINILAREDGIQPDLSKTADQIVAETGIARERINLFLNLYPTQASYRGSGNPYPIIQISARSVNGQPWIQNLMGAAAKAVAAQTGAKPEDIIVYVLPIGDGYFLSDGKIV